MGDNFASFTKKVVSQASKNPPILVIDNLQQAKDLKGLIESVKLYAEFRVMKIVLLCSSSSIAETLTSYSAVQSRGKVSSV